MTDDDMLSDPWGNTRATTPARTHAASCGRPRGEVCSCPIDRDRLPQIVTATLDDDTRVLVTLFWPEWDETSEPEPAMTIAVRDAGRWGPPTPLHHECYDHAQGSPALCRVCRRYLS